MRGWLGQLGMATWVAARWYVCICIIYADARCLKPWLVARHRSQLHDFVELFVGRMDDVPCSTFPNPHAHSTAAGNLNILNCAHVIRMCIDTLSYVTHVLDWHTKDNVWKQFNVWKRMEGRHHVSRMEVSRNLSEGAQIGRAHV